MSTRRVILNVLALSVVLMCGVTGAESPREFRLSVRTEDRRNQFGGTAGVIEIAVSAAVNEWMLGSILQFGTRSEALPELMPAIAAWSRGPVEVVVGRTSLPDWGYGRTGALVLSSRTPPVLQIWGAVDISVARYDKLVGTLDSGGKHIFAHRIALRPSSRFEISFSEVSIVSDRAAAVRNNYLPLWPVYLTQHLKLGGVNNDDVNANMAIGGKWETSWGVIYSDVFVDDMPQRPSHKDAYLVAAQAGLLTPFHVMGRRATLGIEYTRANNWMYTFRHLPYSYTHHGYVLGHWIGPDSDLLDVTLVFPEVELSYRLLRRGEGKIGDVWEDHGTKHAREHSFLTGLVESTHLVRGAISRQLGERVRVTGELSVGIALNAGNVAGARAARVGFSTSFVYSW